MRPSSLQMAEKVKRCGYLLERTVHASAAGQVIIQHICKKREDRTGRTGFGSGASRCLRGDPRVLVPELVPMLNWVVLRMKVFGSEQKSLRAWWRERDGTQGTEGTPRGRRGQRSC